MVLVGLGWKYDVFLFFFFIRRILCMNISLCRNLLRLI